tara:strand:- start:5598 stop:6344 length:747 start_codon:yes stop_codon:yes gene_type:complete
MRKTNYFFNKDVILITGADGHIAKSLIEVLKDKSQKLILLDKSFKKKVKSKFFEYYEVDLSDSYSLKNTIILIKKKNKKIDKIINLAAVTGDQLKNNKKEDNWKKVFQVNLFAIEKLCVELYPTLKKSKNPSILNVSSIYGVVTPKFEIYENTKQSSFFDYSSSKAGLILLTKWLAKKFAPKVNVNCISPGGIYRNHSKKFVKNYSSKTLINRMATEKDIIWPIIFLISKESNYITGQNLIIDGGFSI